MPQKQGRAFQCEKLENRKERFLNQKIWAVIRFVIVR
jgi:hypothetical protein